MQSNYNRWLKLFIFCAGLTIASAFICQWLASDFWWNDEKFSILGLELFYSKKEVVTVLTEIQEPARIALHYQLIFDFAFMAGVYPGIASLLMLMREKVASKRMRDFLFAMAILQPIAWIFDGIENYYLLQWLQKPVIGDEFGMYHNIVILKWLIALVGFFAAFLTWIFRKKARRSS